MATLYGGPAAAVR